MRWYRGIGWAAVVGWSLVCSSVAPADEALQPDVGDKKPTAADKQKPLASKPPAAKPAMSLDDELLKGLGDDPLDGLDKPPAKPKPAAKPAEKSDMKPAKRPKSELDDELLKDLDDVPGMKAKGAPDEAEEKDPLARLNRRMHEVEERLRATKSDESTQQLQHKIVSELEALIEQLAQQQQQSSSSSSSKKPQKQQKSERDRVSQPQSRPAQQQQQQQANNPKPARDSSERQGKPTSERPDPGKMQDLIKDVWGELPPRLRQQMLQSSMERFVPKYELQIEEYFKTLAEEPRDER